MARSVLIVDDNPAFRKLAVRMLVSLGMEVIGEAGTVAQALITAREKKPDAALVDVELPDGNGIELAHELTALPWQPRVLLTSVDAEGAGPDDVRRSGAIGFVPKAALPNGALRRLSTPD
jgi:DNA-binding NarL/FixJ family response regulator